MTTDTFDLFVAASTMEQQNMVTKRNNRRTGWLLLKSRAFASIKIKLQSINFYLQVLLCFVSVYFRNSLSWTSRFMLCTFNLYNLIIWNLIQHVWTDFFGQGTHMLSINVYLDPISRPNCKAKSKNTGHHNSVINPWSDFDTCKILQHVFNNVLLIRRST